jgi:hypothetical protein
MLSGVLFLVWGYIDEEFLSLGKVLAFVVPTLFSAVVVGLNLLWKGEGGLGKLGWLGIALAGYALGWSLVGASVGSEAVWVYFAQRGWPHYLSSWLLFMLIGLTLLGLSMLRSGPARSRFPGASVLATGAFGWSYYVTDSADDVLEARWVHVGFGMLFGLGWVALGVGLLAVGPRRAKGPKKPG